MKISWKAAGLAAVAALVLAGCSSPGSVAGPAGPTVWPAANTSLKGVNLTIWGSSGASTTMKGVVSGFEKLTGADVKIVAIPDPYEQNIQTKVATGDEPDAESLGADLGLIHTAESVVVGESHRLAACDHGQLYYPCRRFRAVRASGVGMEIDHGA